MGDRKIDEVKGISGGSSAVKHTLSLKVDENGREYYHCTSYSPQSRMSYNQDKATGEISGLHLTNSRTGKVSANIPVKNENLGDVLRAKEAEQAKNREELRKLYSGE
jgi:hypothetical protein